MCIALDVGILLHQDNPKTTDVLKQDQASLCQERIVKKKKGISVQP